MQQSSVVSVIFLSRCQQFCTVTCTLHKHWHVRGTGQKGVASSCAREEGSDWWEILHGKGYQALKQFISLSQGWFLPWNRGQTAGGSVGRVQNWVSFPFSALQPAGKEQQASDGLFNTGWKNREFPGNPVVTLRQRAQNILEMPKEKLLHTQIYPAGAFHSSCAVLTAEEGGKIEGVWGQLEKIPWYSMITPRYPSPHPCQPTPFPSTPFIFMSCSIWPSAPGAWNGYFGNICSETSFIPAAGKFSSTLLPFFNPQIFISVVLKE